MVTMKEYKEFMSSPITEQDSELCYKLIEGYHPKPLDQMTTTEFLVFIKICGHDLDSYFPDLTHEQLDLAFRDHVMDI